MSATLTLSPPPAAIVAKRSERWKPFLIALLLCSQLCFCWAARGPALRGQTDLRAFYGAGALVRQGMASQIYDDVAEQKIQQQFFGDQARTLHFLYPAYAALLFIPLTYLPYATAFKLVCVLNLIFLVACAYLLAGKSSNRIALSCWIASLFLCCFPCVIALMQGQITFLLLLIFTSFHLFEERESDFRAGLVLSLGLIKFQFVLPIVLLYLCWKRYRVVSGFLAGALFLGLGSLGMTGLAGAHHYIARMQHLGQSTLLDPAAAHLQYGMKTVAEPNLHGLLVLLTGSGLLSVWLTLALSGIILAWAGTLKSSISVALPVGLLLSYHLQPYDLVLLCLPLYLIYMKSSRESRLCSISAAALLISPISPIVFDSHLAALLSAASFLTLLSTNQTIKGRLQKSGSFPELSPLLFPGHPTK